MTSDSSKGLADDSKKSLSDNDYDHCDQTIIEKPVCTDDDDSVSAVRRLHPLALLLVVGITISYAIHFAFWEGAMHRCQWLGRTPLSRLPQPKKVNRSLFEGFDHAREIIEKYYGLLAHKAALGSPWLTLAARVAIMISYFVVGFRNLPKENVGNVYLASNLPVFITFIVYFTKDSVKPGQHEQSQFFPAFAAPSSAALGVAVAAVLNKPWLNYNLLGICTLRAIVLLRVVIALDFLIIKFRIKDLDSRPFYAMNLAGIAFGAWYYLHYLNVNAEHFSVATYQHKTNQTCVCLISPKCV
ncbi:MAG: hypothetical protein M1828_001141 [Chrysothrix sp. TS-e1954]|nr:MAG: hypothetical protein M1828_001141 [Chrysothrix sp. TS-e1954]